MTLLIPLLLRLTSLFERGVCGGDVSSDEQAVSEETMPDEPERE